MTKMKIAKRTLVFLTAILAIGLLASFASALAVTIDKVELDGMTVSNSSVVAGFSGDSLDIDLFFTSDEEEEDVRVKAWIGGYKNEIEDESERMHLLAGSSYSESLLLRLPEDIDLSEEYTLYVRVEGKVGYVEKEFNIKMQRESYEAEFIEVETAGSANAGSELPVTIIVENIGYEELEDLMVTARLIGTDAVARAYLSDLPSEEDEDGDDETFFEKVLRLKVPSNIASGSYTLEVFVRNGDIENSVRKTVTISGVEKMTRLIVADRTMEAGTDEEVEYEVTLINLGTEVKVYDFVPESNENLIVKTEPIVMVVSAGESKTFTVTAKADEKGTYNFAVKVISEGKVAGREVLSLKVTSGFFNTETTIAVVLAIVFAVLLIVLIVLLTRKPVKTEEFEESYY